MKALPETICLFNRLDTKSLHQLRTIAKWKSNDSNDVSRSSKMHRSPTATLVPNGGSADYKSLDRYHIMKTKLIRSVEKRKTTVGVARS